MAVKLQRFESIKEGDKPNGVVYVFWCPGCEEHHTFTTMRDAKPCWNFNGDMDKPTFTPSLLYPSKPVRCHLFLTDGKLQFLNDCGHNLKGQTVDLPPIPEDRLW